MTNPRDMTTGEAEAFRQGWEAFKAEMLARLAAVQNATPDTWRAGVEVARVCTRTMEPPT